MLIESYYEELAETEEYARFKSEILPKIKDYLLANSRLVITSVHDDLGKMGGAASLLSQIVQSQNSEDQGQLNQIKKVFDAVILDNAH